VIVRLNVSHYRHLLKLDRLTESERRMAANLLAECEAKLAAVKHELKQSQPNVA
jgi:hypothetical protein